MRIVHFIDHLRGDGAQFVLAQIVEGLGARGHRQAVICLNDSWDEPLVRRLEAAGAAVRVVGKIPIALGYGLLSTFLFLRRERFDAALTMLFVSDVVGRALARAARVPRIVTSIQTRDEFYNPLMRWLVRRTMRWADVVELCSENIRDFAVREEAAPEDRIRVIPHSIDPAGYDVPCAREAIRAEFGLAEGDRLIGSLGRLSHQKGYDVLLRALKQASRGDVCLVLAGRGEVEAKLRALAASLGLERNVRFAGYRRDVPDLLSALDVYVQPSRYEGMSVAILQAMAAGRAIVATAVDGTRELIEDGVHGWLVPPEDPAALAAALNGALADPAEAARRGAAARARAAEKFGVKAMIDAWESLLAGEPGKGG